MKDLIRKILKESEDELQWAKDLYDSLHNVPIANGERYIIRLKKGTTLSTIKTLNMDLKAAGWKSCSGGSLPLAPDSVRVLEIYAKTSDEAYIHLKPNKCMSIGSSENIFRDVNGVKFSDIPNVFI